MNPYRLQELIDSLPDTLAAPERARLDAHRRAVSECADRIASLRGELNRSLSGGSAADAARSPVELMVELDSLERVQRQLGERLSTLCEDLTGGGPRVRYGDAQPV